MDLHARSTQHDGRESANRRLAARFVIDAPARQGDLRAEVRELLEVAAVPGDTIEDVLIVMSELLSNAHEHGGADEVAVDVATHGREVWAMVSYQAPVPVEPARLARPTMPAPSAFRGRGLAIVDALAATHEHHQWGETFGTECTFVHG